MRLEPHDPGVRMQLNFGHTLAHALENAMGYGTLLHGEAVSIGMVAAARWGEMLGITPKGTAERIRAVLKGYDLMTEVPDGLSAEALAATMALDKKAEGSTVRAVILTEIGKCTGVPLTPTSSGDAVNLFIIPFLTIRPVSIEVLRSLALKLHFLY